MVVKSPMAGLPPGVATQAADNKEYYFQVYQDLIDYPNSIDWFNDDEKFPEGAMCCMDEYVSGNVSTVINAHVVQSHRRLANMSRWLGRPASEAVHLESLADGIVAGLKRTVMVAGDACDPPAPGCFLDGWGRPSQVQKANPSAANASGPITHTAVQGALFVVGCGVLEPAEALTMLPFLKAKTKTMPLFSAMASNFLLEGLYR